MDQNLQIKVVPFGSKRQKESVQLRDEILRKPLNLTFTKEYLEAESDHIHVVAIDKSSVVGVIVLQPLNEHVIKMRQVAVAKNLQGQGIGREMVKVCERIAKQRGFNKITMHARDVARMFYEQMDYTIKGDSFIEVGIVHYVMEKEL